MLNNIVARTMDLDLAQRLCGSDVHVWVVSSHASLLSVEELATTLSSDEKDRSESFRFEHLKRRFCISRGLLRFFLGAYLATPPQEIKFAYGRYGKPSVAGVEGFQFNVAHSENVTIYAFAFGCALGIDVEQIRNMEDIDGIARHFFCSEEAADLNSIELPERLDAFFACWTRKEAYIKATGEGLSASLDTFRVALRPSEAPSFVHIDDSASEAQSWSLYSLRPVDGYVGALAFRGKRNLRLSSCQPLEDVLAKILNADFSLDDCLDHSL
ncbi:MAG: 4'-phosphopantetheinyl transferase family protein [Bryobacteraceae bacterium]